MVVSQFHDIILRLGNRFNKAHRQATKILLEKQQIAFDTIHTMFCQWNAEYGLVNRPKSDVVCRAIARAFHWYLPRGKFIGRDFKPMSDDYVVPARVVLMELVELAKRVRKQNPG